MEVDDVTLIKFATGSREYTVLSRGILSPCKEFVVHLRIEVSIKGWKFVPGWRSISSTYLFRSACVGFNLIENYLLRSVKIYASTLPGYNLVIPGYSLVTLT